MKEIGNSIFDKNTTTFRTKKAPIYAPTPKKLDFLSVAVLMAATLFLCSQG